MGLIGFGPRPIPGGGAPRGAMLFAGLARAARAGGLGLACAIGMAAGSGDKGQFLVVQSANPPAVTLPFIPDELGGLAQGTTPAGARMKGYAEKALSRFRQRFGRGPESPLEIAVAFCDWVANTMRHPQFWPVDPGAPRYSPLHDAAYNALQPDPLLMLEYTLRFDPADAATWPSPQCGHQNRVVIGLLNTMGIHGRMVALQQHTGLEFFSTRLHKWVYIDSTYNEHYVVKGPSGETVPVNAAEIHAMTLLGRLGELQVVKHGYPGKDQAYMKLFPLGFLRYAVPTYAKLFGEEARRLGGESNMVMVSDDLPTKDHTRIWAAKDPTRSLIEPFWFSLAGVRDSTLVSPVLDALSLAKTPEYESEGLAVVLRSHLPYTVSFQQFFPNPGVWRRVHTVADPRPGPAESGPILLVRGSGRTRLRAIDSAGNATQEFIIHVE
ncbi:MAG TPA: hypothetical protein VK188_18675 [Holophaga sp.]|nr:hypothetical protein [Holophaga sp.]